MLTDKQQFAIPQLRDNDYRPLMSNVLPTAIRSVGKTYSIATDVEKPPAENLAAIDRFLNKISVFPIHIHSFNKNAPASGA